MPSSSPFSRASLAVLLALGCAVAQHEEPATEPFARYRQCIVRKPFFFHTMGRDALSLSHQAEALQQLAADYGRPQIEPEYSRYTIASMLGRDFDNAGFLDALVALRTASTNPADAWLWTNVLRIESDLTRTDEVLAIAREATASWQRAAAIVAIGASRRGDVAAAITPNCVTLPPKDKEGERMLLLGAMTNALWDNRARVNDESYRNALTAYIGLLDPKVGLPKLGRVQMTRTLQAILRSPAQFEDPAAWLAFLARGDVKSSSSQTSAQPSFFGIESDGERFCYVLDLSDSMCIKVPNEHKGPITGPKPKRPKNAILTESDLPWHLIKSRWDLAREQLRISLSRLQPDQWFCVVWFGSDAGTLNATKGLVKATRANLDKAIKELDALVPGEPVPGVAPDGVLRGRTNLFGGLRRAFAVHGGGHANGPAYVEEKPLADGCDTIFLLSDGAPTADDFMVLDKDYGEGEVVKSIEYGGKAPRMQTLEYYGPYIFDQFLIEDVRRMNLFRRVRIHCIGLGEANTELLRGIAGQGGGETFFVGQKR
ncbi:MAG: hypothetical protein JNL12_00370 [Planctomycetes bacterium]|nr:hypothetical protein [Planctomycetota bacterium]